MVRELLFEVTDSFNFLLKEYIVPHGSNSTHHVKRDGIRFILFNRWRYVIALVYRGCESSKSPSLSQKICLNENPSINAGPFLF